MRIRGTNYDDDLYGTSKKDEIYGLNGWDDLFGYGGNDILDGGNGSDLLNGGKGNDSLWGGRGKDFLTGGAGADDFWFDTNDAVDTVNDFGNGSDAIVIDVSSKAFRGVDRDDIYIDHGSKFDKLYIDDVYIAKVYGDYLYYSDVVLIA